MIRSLAAAAVALVLASAASPAAAEDSYSIDPVHSQPTFEVRHMGFSAQRGSFGKATGKVTLDRAAKKGNVEVTIDTTSIKTIDPRLDTHVKGEDFFNVAKYPTMTFKSSNFDFRRRSRGCCGWRTDAPRRHQAGHAESNQRRLRRAPFQQETDVRCRGDDDDQALRMGHEVRHPESGWR